jgi:hypothetical protein
VKIVYMNAQAERVEAELETAAAWLVEQGYIWQAPDLMPAP